MAGREVCSTSIMIHRYVFERGGYCTHKEISVSIKKTLAEVSKRMSYLVLTDRIRRHPTERATVCPGAVPPREVPVRHIKSEMTVHEYSVRRLDEMSIAALYKIAVDGPITRERLNELVLCDEPSGELTDRLHDMARKFFIHTTSNKKWEITETGRKVLEKYEELTTRAAS